MRSLLRFLAPGTGFKRWVAVLLLGTLVAGVGTGMFLGSHFLGSIEGWLLTWLYLLTGEWVSEQAAGAIFSILGVALTLYAIQRVFKAVFDLMLPRGSRGVTARVLQAALGEQGPRIVAMGGGTGLSALLRGLKSFTRNITAVVTVADDGGSSGRLRGELGMLPPGDIRNCLIALADIEPLMEQLMQYRFSAGRELEGHSFGNLFIGAMTEMLGDFEAAIRESSKVLAVRGEVLPATLDNVKLVAELVNGEIVAGESAIPERGLAVKGIRIEPPDCRPLESTLRAIRGADLVVLGPGSLFTSIIPNLLVEGMTEALLDTRAKVVYVANIMTQPGETNGFTAADHLKAIIDHTAPGIVDHIMVNGAPIDKTRLAAYAKEDAHPVAIDTQRLRVSGVSVSVHDLVAESGLARHSPEKLAAALLKYAPQNGIWGLGR